ncbi:hypothetical protein GOBAR_AA10281 [Gossypium barbadense]|uniref:Uncharacterized protein n=1 Tax=Gossypium barbadense TaxID=3634 RepID=A0A2P5Y421_GOSBA|nr:hypothetical protein GOBAR_AA10281 [Gossypium barbadense]
MGHGVKECSIIHREDRTKADDEQPFSLALKAESSMVGKENSARKWEEELHKNKSTTEDNQKVNSKGMGPMTETEKTSINWYSTVDNSEINSKDVGLTILDESIQMGHKKRGWRRLGPKESSNFNMTEAKFGKRKFNHEEETVSGPLDAE